MDKIFWTEIFDSLSIHLIKKIKNYLELFFFGTVRN